MAEPVVRKGLCVGHGWIVEKYGGCICVIDDLETAGQRVSQVPVRRVFGVVQGCERNAHKARAHRYVVARTAMLRAIARGAPRDTAEIVFTDEIWVRDKGICQLCGEFIDFADRNNGPRRFSFDHRHPLHAGGEHTYANIQSAHSKCNSDKGNSIQGDLYA